jgi:type VI secretion system secreted protein Hcp
MASDMFLKVEGVDGESTDEKHPGEIEVLSYTWGVKQQRSGSASSAGNLSAGRADFADFSIVKAIDKSSPTLALSCASGKHIPTVTLELCRAGEDKQPYMEYKFTDVIITSFRPGGSSNGGGETLPLEEVSFAYGKAEWKYTQTKVAGGKGSGNVAGGWDLTKNAKV